MGNTEIENQMSNTVAKSNDIIQNATFNLTATEQKFIAYVISLIKPGEKELQFHDMKVADFAQLCGYNPKNIYSDFKDMIDKLDEKTTWLKIPNGKTTTSFKFRWFSEAKFISNGTIRVLLNSEIKKYLLNLIEQGNYTQYELYNVLGLKSKHSIRLYELLKSYAHKGEINYSVAELKELLGATSYGSIANFYDRVLGKAVKEINTYTDLDIVCTLRDKDGLKIGSAPNGKRVSKVSFNIKRKDLKKSYVVYQKTIDEINKRNRQIKGQLEFDESMNLYEI